MTLIAWSEIEEWIEAKPDQKGNPLNRVGDPGGAAMGHGSPTFLRSRKKKGKQRKKRILKQKLLKDCHQGQNVNVLAILESLEFKNSSRWPTSTFQSSMGQHKGSSFCSTPAKKWQTLRPAAAKNIILRLQSHQDS